MSLRDEILRADDLNTSVVEIGDPAWPDEVAVRELTGADRDWYEREIIEVEPDGTVRVATPNARARILVRSIVDPDSGDLVFTEKDADTLGRKSNRVLDRLFTEVMSISNVQEGMEDFDEMVGNSATGPRESSPTGSPSS